MEIEITKNDDGSLHKLATRNGLLWYNFNTETGKLVDDGQGLEVYYTDLIITHGGLKVDLCYNSQGVATLNNDSDLFYYLRRFTRIYKDYRIGYKNVSQLVNDYNIVTMGV